MQRYTVTQYLTAINSLIDGLRQLEMDGFCCTICGSDDHFAFECGHNPLVAMTLCEQMARRSSQLHDILHHLSGYNKRFGATTGPAKVKLPRDGNHDDPT